MLRKLFTIFICLTIPFLAHTKGIDGHLESLLEKCKKAKSDLEEINSLLDLAAYYREVMYDMNNAEKTYDEIFGKATATVNNDLKILAYKHYLDHIPIKYEHENLNTICNDIIELVDDLIDDNLSFEVYISVGRASIKIAKLDKALRYANNASNWAFQKGTISQQIEAKFLLGAVYANRFDVEEAFRYYSDASVLMEKLQNNQMKKSYADDYHEHLFDLYGKIKNYVKAEEQKQAQIKLLAEFTPYDSLRLMFNKLDIAGLQMSSQKEFSLSPIFEEILSFAESQGNVRLKDYTLSKYRSWLIDSDRFAELKDLMMNLYPEAVESYWEYNIWAHIYEGEGKMDSSKIYFLKEEQRVLGFDNNYLKAHFYRRYGRHFLR